MERHGGYFETQPRDQQDHGESQAAIAQYVVPAYLRDNLADLAQVRVPGHTVEPGHAVDKYGR
jgi:hypothetical protein